jgi:hypothetical protein
MSARVNFAAWLNAEETSAAIQARGAGLVESGAPGRARQKLYRGARKMGEGGRNLGCTVVIVENGGERPLPLRLDLYNHSPDGVEWGYAGSGPSQLSLALLADALGDDGRALSLHQAFKFAYVAHIDRPGFEITAERVREIADELEANLARAS